MYILYILHYTKQSLDLPINKCRFNGKVFLIFSVSPLIHVKLKKIVEFHTSKNIKNDRTKQPITPSFVLYIEYTLNYTFIHFGMSISCKHGSLMISKWTTPISAQNTAILTKDGKQSLINTNREHCFQ